MCVRVLGGSPGTCGEAKDTAAHPAMHRTALETELASNVSSAGVKETLVCGNAPGVSDGVKSGGDPRRTRDLRKAD